MSRYSLKIFSAAIVAVFLACAGSAWAQTVSDGDQQFMKEAAAGGMAEVDLGRLAARKGKNAQVRSFGNRMVRDHSKANADLKSLARRRHVTLPTTMTDEQKTEKANLMKLSGAEFDREYMRMMVEDHDKDVAAFQQKSQDAGDASLKAFVTKTLPTLEIHQKMAHEIQGKVQ
jgi:putative membrane protein